MWHIIFSGIKHFPSIWIVLLFSPMLYEMQNKWRYRPVSASGKSSSSSTSLISAEFPWQRTPLPEAVPGNYRMVAVRTPILRGQLCRLRSSRLRTDERTSRPPFGRRKQSITLRRRRTDNERALALWYGTRPPPGEYLSRGVKLLVELRGADKT